MPETRELCEGWEVRTWCGLDITTPHHVDLDRLMAVDAMEDRNAHPFWCTGCGRKVYMITDAEDREHLVGQLVTIEPFVIEEEPW